MLFCCLLFESVKQKDSNKRIQTKVFKQKKHNHGFPRENNYIPLGYHGSILFLTCPVVFVRDPTIISLNPFSSFFILFHPFSSFFILFHRFFKKKKKGRKRQGQVRYHGFPSENNYIPKGYHAKRESILACKRLKFYSYFAVLLI